MKLRITGKSSASDGEQRLDPHADPRVHSVQKPPFYSAEFSGKPARLGRLTIKKEQAMSWIHLADAFFVAGTVVSAVLLVYGAWLCMNAAGDQRPGSIPAKPGEPAMQGDGGEQTGIACACLLAPAILVALAGPADTVIDRAACMPRGATLPLNRN